MESVHGDAIKHGGSIPPTLQLALLLRNNK